MFAYVARQPIFNVARETYAYEILFRNSEQNCFPDISPDEATSRILTATHLSFGLEEITGDKLAYINFHRDTLINHFPTSLDPTKVVIEIVETVEVDDALVNACKHICSLGYSLALDDYNADKKWQALMPFISIIKFDVREMKQERISELVPELKRSNIRLVAEKVETYEEFKRFRDMGFDYFQGYFLARPEIFRHRQLQASKLAMLELLTASAEMELDFDKVEGIIERDTSLTYLLLRFINNPLFNKRNRITSLRHALNYMGEVEVKKFIALLALSNLSEGQPDELLQMSQVRAKYCELISLALREHDNPPTGFLTGLLSLLDAMMEQPMEDLLEKIPVDEKVKAALCGEQNLLKDCLQLVTFFEAAHWVGIKSFALKYNLKQKLLHRYYIESLKWACAMHASARSKS
ncbi:EAL domain-containing protein [Alteromonas pelagimontana]|uniref:EAL domain-containing protein n=1 Tax=Alteromonas pelagimontana TaxID=1858656 RepID=A0A6M4MEB7_9ALTE|nr:HDOD domain-containing protein [Alteromonas pelagimontana]QJR81449.1 EAL domain-containing protein [Alteromonas pelagimontana]